MFSNSFKFHTIQPLISQVSKKALQPKLFSTNLRPSSNIGNIAQVFNLLDDNLNSTASYPHRFQSYLSFEIDPSFLKTVPFYDVKLFFSRYNVNITRYNRELISGGFRIELDIENDFRDPNIEKALTSLQMNLSNKILVPWFPRHISDLNLIASRTLDAGDKLQSDHPGFSDLGIHSFFTLFIYNYSIILFYIDRLS